MSLEFQRNALIEQLRREGIRSERLLNVMLNEVPRHLFVPASETNFSYEDIPLPIGSGQTISQPYIVARMTEALLEGGPLNRVLEIGTGSGYQAAILGKLANQVYTIERIQTLHEQAKKRLASLNIKNVECLYGDGSLGLKEYAPFDGILVAAASEAILPNLLDQLAEGGRLIIPVGATFESQDLLYFTRKGNEFNKECLDIVRFVPLRPGVA